MNRPKILVVDDVKTNVLYISAILKRQKYNVLEAHSGSEALEIFQRENPDLVLLDITMPEMDGFEVCKRIKAHDPQDFVPVIFLSTRDDMESKEIELLGGGEDFLSKPVEVNELKSRISVHLRTRSLYKELAAAKTIIERERDLIAQIQNSMLPKILPEIPGFGFFVDYQPSSKAGGDYYDFIQIDPEHIGIIICDVSGHGPPAAVIMSMTSIVLRSHLSKIHSPKEALKQLNKILCEHIEASGFISAFYGVIHIPSGDFKYSSAGHNPPLLIDYLSGKYFELKAAKGFPLKISPDNPLEEYTVRLPIPSKLVFYTDGITEAMNPNREIFGIERLAKALMELGKNWSAERLGKEVMKAVQQFHESDVFSDDYTLVIVDVQDHDSAGKPIQKS